MQQQECSGQLMYTDGQGTAVTGVSHAVPSHTLQFQASFSDWSLPFILWIRDTTLVSLCRDTTLQYLCVDNRQTRIKLE